MPKGIKGFQKGNKLGTLHIGYKYTEKQKINLSNAMKGNKNSLNFKHSEKTRKKLSEVHRGLKSHLWKGGISKHYKTGYYSLEYKLWRMSVFKRDNFTCQFCELRCNVGIGKSIYITAHHIKSFANYPELRFNINNGITLCEDCHKLTDNYKGKNKKGGNNCG